MGFIRPYKGLIRPIKAIRPPRPSRGVSIGSRSYSGSPVGYGYYVLKGLGKLWRLIYPIQKVHGKMPRYHNFVCRIQMYS